MKAPKKQPEAKENNLQKCVIWKCLNVCIPYTIYETRQERKVKSCAAFNVHNYFVELSLYCITLGTSMVHLLPVSLETNCAISLLFYVFSFVSKCSFSLCFSFFFAFTNFFIMFARIRFAFVWVKIFAIFEKKLKCKYFDVYIPYTHIKVYLVYGIFFIFSTEQVLWKQRLLLKYMFMLLLSR